MKYLTTLLTIASMATLALSGVASPLNARDVPIADLKGLIVDPKALDLRDAAPLASPNLDDRGVPIGCLAGVFALLTINRVGRVNIQAHIDGLNTWSYDPNSNIHVGLDFTRTYEPIREVRFGVTNRSQLVSNALILSNYRDTIIGTPRHTVRIPIPRATGLAIGTPAPSTYTGCVDLPELDGTWYAQLER